jgi:hypothetical protein
VDEIGWRKRLSGLVDLRSKRGVTAEARGFSKVSRSIVTSMYTDSREQLGAPYTFLPSSNGGVFEAAVTSRG